MALTVAYGLACLSLFALTVGLFRTELVDMLDAYLSHARWSRRLAAVKIRVCKTHAPDLEIWRTHEIRLARVKNTRDRSRGVTSTRRPHSRRDGARQDL
jgi:hypothetical protein